MSWCAATTPRANMSPLRSSEVRTAPPSATIRTGARAGTHSRTTNQARVLRTVTRFMRPATAERFESAMRFFTHGLIARGDSLNDAEADQASDDWEAALAEYSARLSAIRDRMPSPVRELTDLCLHDAELLGTDQRVDPLPTASDRPGAAFWSATGFVDVRQGEDVVSLVYALWDRFREHAPPAGWPRAAPASTRVDWLYEEVDLAPPDRPGAFVQRVLFSDGRVLEIPFVSVTVRRLAVPLNGAGAHKSAKPRGKRARRLDA